MRHLLIVALVTLATPVLAALGDGALQVLSNGMTHELAQTACDEGDSSACGAAGLSGADLARVTTAMIQIVKEGQARCASEPGGDDCQRLKKIDRQANEVLAKKGKHRT